MFMSQLKVCNKYMSRGVSVNNKIYLKLFKIFTKYHIVHLYLHSVMKKFNIVNATVCPLNI